MHSSVPGLVCPTRRAPGTSAESAQTSDILPLPVAGGPVGDYAMVFSYENNDTGSGTPWWHTGNSNVTQNSCQRGPYRQARLSNGEGNSWQPQDSLSRLVDGTSNQILMGEKHIPLTRLGRCEQGTNLTWGDCSILTIGECRAPTSGRLVRHRFAFTGYGYDRRPGIVTPNTQANVQQNDSASGSYHTGVCNFMVGDGSVQALSVTMLPDMLMALGTVDDGVSVSF